MTDCFGLHGHSAFGSVANKEIGVGRKFATSGFLTTDPFNSLQAGKTVDISRCAFESTDLLPPSTTLRLLDLLLHCSGLILGSDVTAYPYYLKQKMSGLAEYLHTLSVPFSSEQGGQSAFQ